MNILGNSSSAGEVGFFQKAGWVIRKITKQSVRRFVFYRNKIRDKEEDVILKYFEGLKEKLGISVIITEEGVLFEMDDFQFMPFWIDKVFRAGKADHEKADHEKDTFTSMLLENECPVSTVDVFYRPLFDESSDLKDYQRETIKLAHKQKTHSDLGQKDLEALVQYSNDTRRRHLRFGVIIPGQANSSILKLIEKNRLSTLDAGFWFFGVLNGFWNKPRWDELFGDIKAGSRGFANTLYPFSFLREQSLHLLDPIKLIKSEGFAETGEDQSVIQLKGFWTEMPNINEPLPPWKLLVTDSWVRDFMPSFIREPGDSIVVATTYYTPKQLERDAALIVKLYEPRHQRLFNKETRELRSEQKAQEDTVKQSEKFLYRDEREFLATYRLSKEELREDKLVFAGTNIIVQSPDPHRTRVLTANINKFLKNHHVYKDDDSVKHRDTQLFVTRSALPVISEYDVIENVFPFPMRAIASSLAPYFEKEISEETLKVFIGEDLLVGDAYFWEFLTSFCLLGGQQSGKTSFLEILAIRLDLLLPKEGVIWFYDGTDAQEEDPNKEKAYGLIPIAKHLNRHMDQKVLKPELRSGVVFASWYESPDKLYNDLLDMVNAGARMIVFSALEKIHTLHNIEFGFFDAYKEHMRSKIPGALFVDEILHLANDERAKMLFTQIAKETSKRNQMFGWTGQTSTILPEKIKKSAHANTNKVCIGATNLIADLATEANINIRLYPDKARILTGLVTEISLEHKPGTFVHVGKGAEIIEVFRAVAAAEKTRQLIHRKPEDERIRLGP